MTQTTNTSPELVFGICAAAGTDVTRLAECVEKELLALSYDVRIIHLSKMLGQIPSFEDIDTESDEFKRISRSMDAGNFLRKKLSNGDAVVRLGIADIRRARAEANSMDRPLAAQAFVIRSLKREEEVKTLRDLYGNNFFLISAYEPEFRRVENLARRIAKARGTSFESCEDEAKELIFRDKKEIDDTFGQRLEDAFPLADVFVTMNEQLNDQIRRFFQALFSHPFITPTKDEFLMFQAWATALRSADLSRQVGAVVADDEGAVLVSGCNEVPRPKARSFWDDVEGTAEDHRDFKEGQDAAVAAKKRIVVDTLQALSDANWLRKPLLKNSSIEKLANEALFGNNNILKSRDIYDLLEYGRMLHAEMAAICDAALRGISVRDATLFCTTFPCHMCARHIVASGLKRVVYIEPYPKSRAKELYRHCIRVDGDTSAEPDAVNFEAFVGVAPRRYISIFSMVPRKDGQGFALEESPKKGQPKNVSLSRFPKELEAVLEDSLTVVMSNADGNGAESQEKPDVGR